MTVTDCFKIMPKETFTSDYAREFMPAVRKGSIGFLAIMQPQLLLEVASRPDIYLDGFAEESARYYTRFPRLKQLKDAFFTYTLNHIRDGEPDLVPQLAKGITGRVQLEVYLKFLQAHDIPEINEEQSLLIYPGTFDPMHYGHRLMISSLLASEAPHARLAINVNSYQARKPHLEETYEQRFADLEYRVLKSSTLDPYRVCAVDFRFGAKEGEDHLRQTRLQSFMSGDRRLRWVIGGDKFLSEVERKEKEEAQGIVGRTLSRFNLEEMSIYVVPRKGQDKKTFSKLVAEFNKQYPAQFICVEEGEYEGEPISSTRIRQYRSMQSPSVRREIEYMEGADLTRDYDDD